MQVDRDLRDYVPCSSQAVETTFRIAGGGTLWGLTTGPYNARKLGLTGFPRTTFVAKAAALTGVQCGLFAGIYTSTRCGIQSYRMKKDLLNASMAGAFTGALFAAAKTRRWTEILGMAALISSITTAVEYRSTI